ERPRIQLVASLAIAQQPGRDHHYPAKDGTHAQPYRKSRRTQCLPLHFSQLPHGNGKPSNGKAEHHYSDGRAYPRQKRPLVGQMIAGSAGIGIFSHGLSGRLQHYSTALAISASAPAMFLIKSSGTPCRSFKNSWL